MVAVSAKTTTETTVETALAVGALAKASGLSVRTLHHYDAIGLLVPHDRGPSGRRSYSAADVARLYRILALRRLRLGLSEIAGVLDGRPDLLVAVREHLAEVDRSLAQTAALRARLAALVERLERDPSPTLDDFLTTIEEMTMIERYYSVERLAELAERREQLGADGLRRAEGDWAALIADVRAERERGTAPTDARMRPLAERWRALIEQFTGGDPGVRDSLARMYEQEGPERASRGSVDGETMDYVARALAALDSDHPDAAG